MDSIMVDSYIDEKIYLDFCRFHRFYTNKFAWNIVIFPAFILGFAVFNLFLKNVLLMWILIGLALFVPAWMLLAFHLTSKRQAEAFDVKHPRVFYSLLFDEKGIHVSNEKEKADYPWKKVLCIFRTKRYFYLYFTPSRAFIIPFTCIKQGDEEGLWKLLQKMTEPEKLMIKHVIYE